MQQIGLHAACACTRPVKVLAAGSRTGAAVQAVPGAPGLRWTRCASLSAACCHSREQCSSRHCPLAEGYPPALMTCLTVGCRGECVGANKRNPAAGVRALVQQLGGLHVSRAQLPPAGHGAAASPRMSQQLVCASSLQAHRLAFIRCLVADSRGQCSVTTSHWGSSSSRVSM